ncbi:hypothetical protein MKEN_00734800 [Mycena kentingensis (nom. inval.)]|nr:hypothetical protein MKEN_00734800 [Mycena kentingensis (nom. inval.)]
MSANLDPMVALLARANLEGSRGTSPEPILGASFDPASSPDSDTTFGAGNNGEQHSFFNVPFVSLVSFVPVLVNAFGITGSATTLLHAFCQPISFEERLGYIFAALLHVIALREAEALREAQNWVISQNIKNLVKLYAVGFLICPQTSASRGNDAAAHIANAIRESHPGTGIPVVGDLVRGAILTSYINKKLTAERNIIKKKRFCFVSYGGGDDFWLKVDATMNIMRSLTALGAATALQQMYKDDIVKFGDPANNTTVTVADPTTVPPWQLTLARHAALVAPYVEPESSSRGAKRARVDEPEMDLDVMSDMGVVAGPSAAGGNQ